jgi:hypothetical protein
VCQTAYIAAQEQPFYDFRLFLDESTLDESSLVNDSTKLVENSN